MSMLGIYQKKKTKINFVVGALTTVGIQRSIIAVTVCKIPPPCSQVTDSNPVLYYFFSELYFLDPQ